MKATEAGGTEFLSYDNMSSSGNISCIGYGVLATRKGGLELELEKLDFVDSLIHWG